MGKTLEKEWHVKIADARLARGICRKTGCHQVTAAVLVNRGFDPKDDIFAFLNPSLLSIDTYFALKDMEKAVLRITEAIVGRQKILVFGDYDVDGITASTIVWWFLKKAGADAEIYIPHRISEGYGLRLTHVKDVFVPEKINLVITADCGSGSCQAVTAANASGIDVVITDHHDIDIIPPAFAVINPKRDDCSAGLDHLAGVGVAFYLLVCLRKHLRETEHWKKFPEPNLKEICDLVALGTIADIVPLVRENRILVKTGMDVMNSSPRCGIKALMNISGISKPVLESDDLAFKLAPRLNAAGRVDHAKTAVKLLCTEDEQIAAELADKLNRFNIERQNMESGLQQQIIAYLEQEDDLERLKSIILIDQDWHQGVLGIVASRLADRFFRPVILLSKTGDTGVGSARSIPGIDLYDSLSKCSHLLETYGGHAMAAGLKITGANFSAFKEAFDTCITDTSADCTPVPVLDIDCELDFDMISELLADEIQSLAPFGEKNREPLFSASGVEVKFARIVGRRHLQLSLVQSGSKTGKILPAIFFNVNPEDPLPSGYEKIAYRLQWNHYNGSRKLQLVIEAIKGTRVAVRRRYSSPS